MAASSLREASLPRFALRRGEAAAALAISPGTFDSWIENGRLPKGKRIDGVVVWDVERLRDAWLRLYEADNHLDGDDGNPFDELVV
ncbi:helix-turn-helix transcriptional regulator [Shinella fusca]|uniref:Putative DNA-binding transcriptional regulator AlpA n=1 Tax=Shinella fusca TaxID=544480 RepID=A0A7W7YX81_9HYPH|nr:hypothetical protein [Shinella fusca]MBB5044036.1 putative DNA-binding transcriptional regulator AlpA [Shinella fusca]